MCAVGHWNVVEYHKYRMGIDKGIGSEQVADSRVP